MSCKFYFIWFPRNVESPKWRYKLGTSQFKRWRKQKSKKSITWFSEIFSEFHLDEFSSHHLPLKNHNFLEHSVTRVLKSPTPKKRPLSKNPGSSVVSPKTPRTYPMLDIVSGGLEASHQSISWKEIEEETQLNSNEQFGELWGVFVFWSSRFFSAIFFGPPKKVWLFFRGKIQATGWCQIARCCHDEA